MTLCHEVPAIRPKGHYCAKIGGIIATGFYVSKTAKSLYDTLS